MIKNMLLVFPLFIVLACGQGGVKQQEDEIYSRHLQTKIKLTILHTPIPADKSELHLLLLNDGQEMDKLGLKHMVDSLYHSGKIMSLLIVGIHAVDRMQEYGVAGQPDYAGRGNRAGFYDAFINDELYPFVKKRAGVRKFKSVAIAGCSLGGLSAFDIAWNHPDKIDRVAVFSGSFWWRDKDAADSSYSDEKNRIILSKIRTSRKKPRLQFWFYVGGSEETSDRDKDGIIDAEDDTRDLVSLLKQKKLDGSESIVYHESASGKHDWPYWKQEFPSFLIWAFGK